MRTSVDLHNYLQAHNVPHEISLIEMSAKTTEMAAVLLGLDRSEIGKSLLLEIDDIPAIVIVPGNRRLDIRKLKSALGANRVKFVEPDDVAALTGYMLGSMPPIAHLNKLPVYMDMRLLTVPLIYTNGGQSNTVLKVRPQDLASAVNATIVDIADDGRV